MLIRFVRGAALAVPALIIAGCAAMTRPPAYGLDDSGAHLVRQTCKQVMGLRESLAEFDACGNSLADSVRSLREGQSIAAANRRCEEQGLVRGTPELAKCVVLTRSEIVAAGSADPVLRDVSDAPAGPSWFSMSAAQQSQRMELSCAELGLHPASSAFGHCLTSLKDSIVAVQYPPPP